MEYVEGKTLDPLIPRKGMKLNEALKYSAQIADALAVAHAAGIVHRDLKPANVCFFSLWKLKRGEGLPAIETMRIPQFRRTDTLWHLRA